MSTVITSAATDHFITALCNTLVYSLLQGVLLAVAAGLIIVCTRKASAAVRYNMLVAIMALFAVGAMITFAMQFDYTLKQAPTQAAYNPVGAVEISQFTQVSPTQPAVNVSLTDTLTGWLNANHNSIVLVWFLIICARCIQLATGLQGIYRLKRNKVYQPDNNWAVWTGNMTDRLGIKQKIALLESGIAKVPMVIGHLKPVILIPVGLLTALSTAEIEAIILHELAHIRRRDYLVNLLQNMVEIVFFFNPAVLWVSQLIKTEREHYCDDMALAQNTSRSEYIRALVSCEEYQATPAYAMAFPGQKNHLVDRVKRLVTKRNHSLDVFEKTLLTICLVISGLCLSAYAEKDTIKRATHAVVAAIKNQATKSKRKEQVDDRTSRLDSQTAAADSKAAELDSAEPGVPSIADQEADTTKKANQQNRQINLNNRVDSANNYHTSGRLSGSLGQLGPMNNQNLSRRIDSINNQVRVNYKQNKLSLKEQMRIDSINTQVRVNFNKSKLKEELARLDSNAYLKVNSNQSLLKRQAYLDTAKQYKAQAKVYAANPIATRQPYKVSKLDYKPRVDEDKDRREAAINEMIKDGLVKSKDNLSFKLSNKEFILNGKKQPEAVYQKYKAKYVKDDGRNGEWSWLYNYDTAKHQESNTVIDNTSQTDTVRTRPSGLGGRISSVGGVLMEHGTREEMVKDGIIKNIHDLVGGISLNENEFIVNGKKQPEPIHQKYLKLMSANTKSSGANGSDKFTPPSTQWIADVIADLKADDIVAGTATKNEVSFKIDTESFTVNGKTQPDAIFKKYNNKYVKPLGAGKPGLSWNMGGKLSK